MPTSSAQVSSPPALRLALREKLGMCFCLGTTGKVILGTLMGDEKEVEGAGEGSGLPLAS